MRSRAAAPFALAAALLAGAGLAAAPERAGSVATSLTIFAGTARGLWRSTDWGGSWERVEGAKVGDSVKDVGAVHAILTGVSGVHVGADAGLFVSPDFGQTWKAEALKTPVNAILPSRYPLADLTVFAGTAEGLLRSEDAGHTFVPTILRSAVSRMEWPGPDLVLATANGVFVSPDGGKSFRSGAGLPDGPVEAIALSSYFAVDPVLFAGTSRGIYRSADAARTWRPAGLVGQAVHDIVWFGPVLYVATDQGVFRSIDAGGAWELLGEGLAGRQARRLLFPLAPDSAAEAFVGTDRGVFHTPDGGQHWVSAGDLEEPVLVLATFPPPERHGKAKPRR